LPDKKNIGDKCPHFADDDGKYDNINTDWWVSGFWPGMLWIMYDITGEESYWEAAWSWDVRQQRREGPRRVAVIYSIVETAKEIG
jgi:hypothetical protein